MKLADPAKMAGPTRSSALPDNKQARDRTALLPAAPDLSPFADRLAPGGTVVTLSFQHPRSDCRGPAGGQGFEP